MSDDILTELALQLLKLGVSKRGTTELLSNYPREVIQQQLAFLPFRKARRPEAMIVKSIRDNFSPPPQFFIHAKDQTHHSADSSQLDKGSELSDSGPDADPFGHGSPRPVDPGQGDIRVEQAGISCNIDIPVIEETDGSV